jgi:hypothetical protein
MVELKVEVYGRMVHVVTLGLGLVTVNCDGIGIETSNKHASWWKLKKLQVVSGIDERKGISSSDLC